MIKKQKIEDKVELENIIEYYLKNDLPFSLLESKYDLTYPQRQLLLIKSIGYTRQSEILDDFLPEYGHFEISDDILRIPHNIREEYPLDHEARTLLFKRMDELKNGNERSKELNMRLDELRSKLDEYSVFEEDFNNITDYLKELDRLEDEGKVLMASEHGNLLKEYSLTPVKSQQLSKVYAEYLKLQEEFFKCSRDLEKICFNNDFEKNEYESIREKLVVTNIKLVNWCIRNYFKNMPLPKEDTQALGLEALATAINSFDYKQGFHFSSFAVKVITHNIQRYFSTLTGMTFAEYCKKQNIKYWREELSNMDSERTKPYTAQELADSGLLKYTAAQIRKNDSMIDGIYNFSDITEYPGIECSKRYEMPFTFEDYDFVDSMEEEFDKYIIIDEEDALAPAFNSVLADNLNATLETLTDREREILIDHHGLNGHEPLTLEEIGYKIHVSRERVRQIEAKALRKLRHPSRLRALKEESYSNSNSMRSATREEVVDAYRKLYFYRNSHLKNSTKAFFINNRYLEWNESDVEIAMDIMDFILHDIENDYGNYEEMRDHVYAYVRDQYLSDKWWSYASICFNGNGKIYASYSASEYPFYSIISALAKSHTAKLKEESLTLEKTQRNY